MKKYAEKMYKTILALETEEECEQFFEDLCSPSELSALKQRFAVATMIRQDKVYNEIFKETGAGTATISRVKRMMNYGSGCMPMLMERVEKAEKDEGKQVYVGKVHEGPVNALVEVPGSKSVTNRALLLAALSVEKTVLEGVLFSDDSRHFLGSLKSLGYKLDISEKEKKVRIQGTGGKIPEKTGKIDVGSAGTAARFLTAMLALSDGEYIIECSKQMERRPMKPLFEVLTSLGAEFTYLKEKGYLPVKVKGNKLSNENSDKENELLVCRNVSMDISESTQFLSALLMVLPVMNDDFNINITSEKKTGAYIGITINMLKDFGVNIDFDGNAYHIKGKQKIRGGNYTVEPDVSAACYFYAAAAITGGSITVKNIRKNLMQGDMQFIKLLERIGCTVSDVSEGIRVKGPENGIYDGIDVDMNNFSDQALTMAAVAAFARTKTTIRNVGHIRGQECDRMKAIVNELSRCGIEAFELGDDIVINPGDVHGAIIETYDDHRVAMAFSLLSLRVPEIIISNPMCCRKTFENYFEIFETI